VDCTCVSAPSSSRILLALVLLVHYIIDAMIIEIDTEIAILAHNRNESKSKSGTVTKTIFRASRVRLMHVGKFAHTGGAGGVYVTFVCVPCST